MELPEKHGADVIRRGDPFDAIASDRVGGAENTTTLADEACSIGGVLFVFCP